MDYKDIVLSPTKNRGFIVMKEIIHKDLVIPIGFSTDGADIPRIFWSFIPPNDSEILPAIVVHDYLCDLEDYEKADLYFEEILNDLDIGWLKKVTLVLGVTIYRKYLRKLVKKIEKLKVPI